MLMPSGRLRSARARTAANAGSSRASTTPWAFERQTVRASPPSAHARHRRAAAAVESASKRTPSTGAEVMEWMTREEKWMTREEKGVEASGVGGAVAPSRPLRLYASSLFEKGGAVKPR